MISGVCFTVWGAIVAGGTAAAICVHGSKLPKILGLVFIFGCIAFAAGVIFLLMYAVKKLIERRRNKRLIEMGLLQNPAEDVIRKPIEPDDEKGFAELEVHTKSFLKNVVYPEGFIDFLTGFNSEEVEKGGIVNSVFMLNGKESAFGSYCALYDVYKPEELKKVNEELLLYTSDYHTQFRDVLFFADDESGHCHFLLDYGKDGEPKVKYLDEEADVVILLADTFKQFVERLISESAIENIN